MSDHAVLMDKIYRRQRHIYDATRKFYLLGRDPLIAGLAPPDGGAVLEIACGTGRNLIAVARRWPRAQAHGFDISEAMLATARANVARAGLADRITLAQGDAAAFDPAALFGRASFDRVVISYALSMIPPWRAAIDAALATLAPKGELHVVDFGDQAHWPAPLRGALRRWLDAFEVSPREDLRAALDEACARQGRSLAFAPKYRRYAALARIGPKIAA